MTSPASEDESVLPISNETAISTKEADQQNLCDRCRSLDLDNLSADSPNIHVPVSSLKTGCCYCDSFRMIASECIRGSDTNTLLEIIISISELKNLIALYISICERSPKPNGNSEDLVYKLYLVTLEHQREEFRQTAGTCLDNEPAFISMIQTSLERCRISHSECHRKRSGMSVPLKVVDCQSRTLCTIDPDASYAALSYVWGNVPAQPLLSPQTLPLPKTIEDALSVCLRVGIQYMWVDRYCIDQGNPQEKHTLISQMDKIYRGAELTIIAVAGENPAYGLAGVNDTPRRRQIEFQTRDSKLFVERAPGYQVQFSTWIKRGWTYQEVLLSSRRVYFTEWETFFECQSLSAQEMVTKDSGIGTGGPIYSWHLPDQSFKEIYERITEYSYRDLTYPEDAIHGMEAILRSFQFTYEPSWPFGASEGIQNHQTFLRSSLHKPRAYEELDILDWPTLGGRKSQCLLRGYADVSVMVMGNNKNVDTGNNEV